MTLSPMPLRYVVTVDGHGVYKVTDFVAVGIEPVGTNKEYIGSTEIQNLLNLQAGRIEDLEAAQIQNSKSGRIVD